MCSLMYFEPFVPQVSRCGRDTSKFDLMVVCLIRNHRGLSVL